MTLTTRVLLGLLAGLTLGLLTAWLAPESSAAIAALVEPVGTLWTRGLMMTVIPLVVPLLFVGVLSGGRGIGRLGARGLGLFLVMLSALATLTLLVAPAIFARVPIDPAAAEALRATSSAPPGALPGFRDWLVALVPSNLIAAASAGAMLPLIVATLVFGAAATRLPDASRELLGRGARAITEVTLVVVRWLLLVAPLGVLALAFALASRLGLAALGAMAVYVGITAGLSLLAIGLLYPLVASRGVSVRAFARAVLPAQGIAVSARSSMAALPALIDGATALGLPQPIRGFFLPFSTSLFRLGAAVALPAGVIFIARIYGVPLDAAQLVTVGVTSVLLSLSVSGIPGGSILIMAPVLLSVGAPVEGIGILLAVDTIPDMFRTTANVTGSMAAAVILGPTAGAGDGPRNPG
jgi:Na+/H+-dicarboxylate symporter